MENRKKTINVILSLFVLSHICFFFTQNVYVVFSTIAITLMTPFLILVVAITGGEAYKKIMAQKWIVILISLVFVFYTALANIYAATLINEIFKVNSGLLPITTVFLTFAYFIVTYLKPLIFIPYIASLTLGGLAGVLIILVSGSFLVVTKRLAKLIFAVFFFSLTASSIHLFEKLLPTWVKYVALKADFSSHHRCDFIGDKSINRILFMPSGSVLAEKAVIENNTKTTKFIVLQCNVAKKL
jgi:hypothetical protein